MLECIRRLIEVDKAWVPDAAGTSLYVRPVLIGNEVGPTPGLGNWAARWDPAGQGRGPGGLGQGRGRDWGPGLLTLPLCPSQPSLGVAQPTSALLFVILCPVGAYFPGGSVTPVSLLADPTFIRAWVGGVGNYKLGG